MSTANHAALRVVFDTNVYYSAFSRTEGVPFRILQKAFKGKCFLIISPDIIREIAEVLRSKLGRSEKETITMLKALAKAAEIVNPQYTFNVIKNDPDDDRILECAVEGKADLIVSGDSHLLRLKSFRGIGIVRPIDFYRILGE